MATAFTPAVAASWFGVALLAGGAEALGDDVVVPSALVDVEGGASSHIVTDWSWEALRYQQVHAGSELGAGAISIERIAFRPDGPTAVPFSLTLTHVRITLSTTSREPDGLSVTFADNIGADEVVVFDGDLDLSSAAALGPGGTRAFDIVIDLTTPFIFNAGAGNLLMDLQRDGSGLRVSFDAQETMGDAISRAYGRRGSASATQVDTFALVTQFTATPVPVTCPADLNDDGLVDFVDFLIFLNYYIAQDPAADFTGDDLVDFSDYLDFLNLYYAGC